jgi:hypothetical protein
MERIFITASNIKTLKRVSYKTACKIFNNILKKYDLPKERELSMKSFCEYYNVREEKVHALLDQENNKVSKNKTIVDSL